MENFDIFYSKKKAKLGLVIGLIVLAISTGSYLSGNTVFPLPFAMSLVLIASFFYKKSAVYLQVRNGYLKKDFGARIPISDIVETRRLAGEYVFKSKGKKIVVDKDAVDKDAVLELDRILNYVRSQISNN